MAATTADGQSQPQLTPLANQVAGHPEGVQSLEGGRLVVKDCLHQELHFYGLVRAAVVSNGSSGSSSDNSASSSAPPVSESQAKLLERLHVLMPEFHGSWDEYAGNQASGDNKASRIVLENLTHGYIQPNVCDIKLGTQLWDDAATEEKRQRMDQAARNTTSGMCGVRLTGWQVWDNHTNSYHIVPKTFGKTIQAPDLLVGARMLLASPKPGDAERAESILPGSSRVRVKPPTSDDEQQLESGFYLPDLPPAAMAALLQESLIPTLEQLVDIFSQLEVRIRGGSILIVFEGHIDTLTEGLNTKLKSLKTGKLPPGQAPHRLVDVRFIDFAHASLVQGQGPDEGVLLGLKTTLELLRNVASDLGSA